MFREGGGGGREGGEQEEEGEEEGEREEEGEGGAGGEGGIVPQHLLLLASEASPVTDDTPIFIFIIHLPRILQSDWSITVV